MPGQRTLTLLTIGAMATLSAVSIALAAAGPQTASQSPSAPSASWQKALLDRYCVTCHNAQLRTAGLTLDLHDVARVGDAPEVWEKVVRKLRAGVMPPSPRPRPDTATYDRLITWLESELDETAAANVNPGRTEAFHRLNRTEYHNAIRDLLDLEVDVAELLPADGGSYGFDNIAGCSASPRRCWSGISWPRGRSAAWRWVAPRRRSPPRPFASRATCRRTIGSTVCRSARVAGRRFDTRFPKMATTSSACA